MCLVYWMENSASAVLSDHQILFVASGNRINTAAVSPVALDSYLYTKFSKWNQFYTLFVICLYSYLYS